MGGAALGADVTAGPRPIVPGSLGVFGGTFDPIHLAHLAVAEEAAEALGLERILFMPAGEPPHKPGLEITPRDSGWRWSSWRSPATTGSRWTAEIDREGPSYTVDTLEDLRRRGCIGRSADLTLCCRPRRSSG